MRTTLAALCIGMLVYATSAVAQELPPSLGSKPAAMSLEDAIQAGAPPVITENALRVSRIELRLDQDDRGQWTTGASNDWRFRGIGSEVQLELFPGEVLWMKGVSVEDAENASSWVGEVLHPEPGIAIITRAEDGVYGTFDVGTQRYALVSDASMAGKAFAKQVDVRDIGACPVGGEPGEGKNNASHENNIDAPNWVRKAMTQKSGGNNTMMDLMFLYTPEAYSHVGSFTAFVAFMNNLVASMNTAFSASSVTGSVRAVYYGVQSGVSTLGDYDDYSGEVGKMYAGEPPYSGLAVARNNYSADIIVLFVKKAVNASLCGIVGGYEEYPFRGVDFFPPNKGKKAYAIVSVDCADDDRTFHHELGHLLGGWHNEYYGDGCGIDGMSCGYTDINIGFHTIMGAWNEGAASCSVNSCPRLLRFSDYQQSAWVNGGWRPLGMPRTGRYYHEDFVGTMNGEGSHPATIPYVASYRTPQGPAPGTPSLFVDTCASHHTVSWGAGTGNVGWYEVRVSSHPAAGSGSTIYRGPMSIVNYNSSTPIYMHARSCNAVGCSAWVVNGPSVPNPATCQ